MVVENGMLWVGAGRTGAGMKVQPNVYVGGLGSLFFTIGHVVSLPPLLLASTLFFNHLSNSSQGTRSTV